MVRQRNRRRAATEPPVGSDLISAVRSRALPVRSPSDLDPLMERIGDARYVLLGEASHGTHEFYTWRAAISRRLIEEKGFSFIAVEGDWPDCYRVNRYSKGAGDAGENAREVLENFQRWPTWMWANEEVVELAEWLRLHNARRREGHACRTRNLNNCPMIATIVTRQEKYRAAIQRSCRRWPAASHAAGRLCRPQRCLGAGAAERWRTGWL